MNKEFSKEESLEYAFEGAWVVFAYMDAVRKKVPLMCHSMNLKHITKALDICRTNNNMFIIE